MSLSSSLGGNLLQFNYLLQWPKIPRYVPLIASRGGRPNLYDCSATWAFDMSSPSYDAVEARRELEIEMIKEKLERNESVETPVCRVERVST